MSESRHRALVDAAYEVVDELVTRERCYCDEPGEGESGVIECTPCRDRRLANILLQALPSRPTEAL